MSPKFRLHRNVYIIILSVLLMAAVIQIARSQYVLRFSHNEVLAESAKRTAAAASENTLTKTSVRPYCLVFDSTEEYSVKVKNNAERTLKYMKKPVQSFDVRSGETFRPDNCAATVLSIEQLKLLGDPDVLARYVEQGGYAFFAVRPELDDTLYRLYRKMGILAIGEFKDSDGIQLTSNVLIGEAGLTLDDSFITNPTLTVELDEKSRVLAKTAEGVPLLWDFAYGQGKFMTFNGAMLQEKINRGMLAGAISLLEPDFIYPVFNSKIMYIDDFPAPIPQGTDTGVDAEIYRDYRRDIPTFYKQIWWPDMLKAAKQNDIKYTAVLIESYHDQIDPPFEYPTDADSNGLISYGREVIKSGGEIGLHGYNHQSLTLSQEVADEFNYKPWKSVGHMADSIAEAVRFMGSAFPKYTMLSYVPPSNVLSPEGREALKQGWPSIAVISSLYGEDASGIAYVQEFEMAQDGILEMPRVTSGYFNQPFERWAEANTITALGIFSHFIHPDDLLDPKRNRNLSWEELYEQYSGILARVKQTHPWLRSMTSTEAAVDMKQVLASDVAWSREGNRLRGQIAPFQGKAYFVLRTDKKIGKLTGCAVRKIDDGTYLVTAGKANFEIELGE
ncbi:DUF2194 domain-containing protein [Paenibacillus elgii]